MGILGDGLFTVKGLGFRVLGFGGFGFRVLVQGL